MNAHAKNMPVLVLAQRYRWQPGDEQKPKGKRPVHPGFCEAGDGSCCNVATASFTPKGGGRLVSLCNSCIDEMTAAGMIEGAR